MNKIKLFVFVLLMSISLVACDAEEAPKENDREVVEETKKTEKPKEETKAPEATLTATTEPTAELTIEPTAEPTLTPTVEPTIEPTKEPIKEELEIHFIDCGNGDAIYVECGDSTMLIDAGDEKGAVTSYLDKELEDKLDYIIQTHPHADHLADMSGVVSGYTDNQTKIIVSPAINNTKIFEDFLDSVADAGLKLTKAEVGTEYELGDAAFTIVGPVSEEYSDLNDYSVGIFLEYGDFTFLSMGDAEGKAEKEMLDTGIIENVTLYKASHHGSWVDDTNSTIFNKVKPSYLVVPCSIREENTYGHPHIELVDYAIKNNVFTYLTGYQSDIVFKVSGDKVNVNVMPYDKLSELLIKPTPEPTVKPTIKPTVAPTKAPVATKKPVATKTPTKKPVVTKAPVVSKTTYILNTNTKKIHVQGCRYVITIKDVNREEWTGDTQSLLNSGYSNCKTCIGR